MSESQIEEEPSNETGIEQLIKSQIEEESLKGTDIEQMSESQIEEKSPNDMGIEQLIKSQTEEESSKSTDIEQMSESQIEEKPSNDTGIEQIIKSQVGKIKEEIEEKKIGSNQVPWEKYFKDFSTEKEALDCLRKTLADQRKLALQTDSNNRLLLRYLIREKKNSISTRGSSNRRE